MEIIHVDYCDVSGHFKLFIAVLEVNFSSCSIYGIAVLISTVKYRDLGSISTMRFLVQRYTVVIVTCTTAHHYAELATSATIRCAHRWAELNSGT